MHRLGFTFDGLKVFVVAWVLYVEEQRCHCRTWRPIGRKCSAWERLIAADDDRPLRNIVDVIHDRLDEVLPLDS